MNTGIFTCHAEGARIYWLSEHVFADGLLAGVIGLFAVIKALTPMAVSALYSFGLQDAGAEHNVLVHTLAIDHGLNAEFSAGVPRVTLCANSS